MAKKKKRRAPQAAKPVDPTQPELSPEERAARRAQQKADWAAQKHAQQRAASQSYAPLFWSGSVVAVLVVAGIAGFLLFGGGGSSSSTPTPGPTADARVAGQAPAEKFDVQAQDDGVDVNPRFSPNAITAKTGEVFEIDVTNSGSSAHNLVVAGLDGQFGTSDDFISDPSSIAAGGTGKVLVRIDKPGTYQFHCDFHPTVQIGTLTIVQGPSASATPTGLAAASGSTTPTPSPTPTPTPTAS